MKIFKSILVFTAIAAFVFACAESPNTGNGSNANTENFTANSPQNTLENVAATPAPTIDEIASGKQLYNQNCAKCHKEDGSGGEVTIEGEKLKVEDLRTDKMKKEPDSEYIEYMVKGIPSEGMPSFKDELTETQMQQIVKYIREEIQK